MVTKHQLSILLVEDDPDARSSLQDCLKEHFTDVIAVASAKDAILKLQSMPFQAVICDYNLGQGESGLAVKTWINANTSDIHFVLLTGYAQDAELLRFLEVDHFTVLQKPAHIHELVFPLRRLSVPLKNKKSA